MTTPTALLELIKASAAEEIDERPGFAAFDARLSDPAVREQWHALVREPPEMLIGVSITYADSDHPLEPGVDPEAGDIFRININVREVDGELRLFWASSLQRCLDELPAIDAVRIAELEPSEAFSTDRFRLEVWTSDPCEPYAQSARFADPRSFVKDFTAASTVPGDVRPWLLRRAPTRQGEAFAIWRRAAGSRLLMALANQVSEAASAIAYHFSGPPTRAVKIPPVELEPLFERLTQGAAWVYRDGRDAEARHLLLSNELGRTWKEAEPNRFGTGALESARSAYEAYVRSGSKETLKALAELRKAVIDEAQKVAQRAQDLASALWKDLAVAAIPLAIKALPDGAKGTNKTAAFAALVAALFLTFSFAVQVYVNRRHLERLDESRQAWKRALNVALSDNELEEISERPLRHSTQDYDRVRIAVGIVYLTLVLGLLAFSLHHFQTS